MKYRKLGKSDIEVSEIGLGCWTMGGRNWTEGVSIGWADVNENEVAQAINYALEQGVNHFDNADVYGNGKAERMLARILGNRTKDVIIATKIGWFQGTAEHAYEPAHIRHQCEQSLINLKRDYIDIYYFHHGNFGENDKYLDDAIEVMNRLKDEGKIRIIGQSAYSNEDFVRLIPKVKPEVIQSFANSTDDRFIADNQPVRKMLEEYKISFVAFAPVAKGLLLGKYNSKNPPKFEEGDHRKNDAKLQIDFIKQVEPKLELLKNKFGSSVENLSRAALQYLLHYKVVGCVIPGFRNLEQVKINLSAADKPLTDEEFDFIRNTFREMQKY